MIVTDRGRMSRGHLGEARLCAEVRRLDGLVPLQRRRAVHLDAQTLEDLDVVVEHSLAASAVAVGQGAPHARISESIGTFSGGRFLRRNNREVGTTDDDVLERIESRSKELTIFVMSKSLS